MSYFTCPFFFFNTTALSFNFLFITVYKACPESVSCKSAFFFPFSNAERKTKILTRLFIILPRSSTGDFLSQRFIHLREPNNFLNEHKTYALKDILHLEQSKI